MRIRITNKERTAAINKYARKHNLYPSLVRTCTDLKHAALRELCEKKFVEALLKG